MKTVEVDFEIGVRFHGNLEVDLVRMDVEIHIVENRLVLGTVIEGVCLAHLRREVANNFELVDNHLDSDQNRKNWNMTIPDPIALSIHKMMKRLTE